MVDEHHILLVFANHHITVLLDLYDMKVVLGPFANTEDGPKVSRGLRGLSTVGKSSLTTQEEYKRLKAEASQIEHWWANKQRWGHTRRPYSGKHCTQRPVLETG